MITKRDVVVNCQMVGLAASVEPRMVIPVQSIGIVSLIMYVPPAMMKSILFFLEHHPLFDINIDELPDILPWAS